MKKLMSFFLFTGLIVPALASAEITLHSRIVQTNNTTVVTPGSTDDSLPDVDTISSERVVLIGWDHDSHRQVMIQVSGCGRVRNKTNTVIKIADSPDEYQPGLFNSRTTTYKLKNNSREECQAEKRRLDSISFENPLVLQLRGSEFSITD